MSRALQNTVDALALALLPCVLAACAIFQIKAAALLSLLTAVAGIAVMFAGWEKSTPALRQILPPSVLAAIAVAGRVVFMAAPNIQPVTAICVISGSVFGKRAGFMTGSLAALVSSFFLGLGAWTPWQMYAWGLVGYIAGLLFHGKGDGSSGAFARHETIAACIYGAVASLMFGAIMDTWTLVGFVQPVTIGSALAIYGAGIVFNVAHAASTVAFLLVLFAPWRIRLQRISRKYAL